MTLRNLAQKLSSLVRPRNADKTDQRLIAASGLFDASYYLMNGADVAAAGAEPIEHFYAHGWQEGRRPNLFFDPDWYRSRYLSAERPDYNPLSHYIRQGERDGCKPICFFDPAWYRRAYDLRPDHSPLVHYLAHRRTQRFAPNPDFDIAFYLDRHRDEIGTNRDPFMHHIRNGAALRDLAPLTFFSTRPPIAAR